MGIRGIDILKGDLTMDEAQNGQQQDESAGQPPAAAVNRDDSVQAPPSEAPATPAHEEADAASGQPESNDEQVADSSAPLQNDDPPAE